MLDKELKNERGQKNLFEEFDEWTKLHYYAFKLRKLYPNLFFHYFNSEGVIKDSFTMEERKTILTNLKKFKNSMNGMCGYLSLLLKNKNGILTYKMLNNSEFYDHSISTPCIQDASSKFSEEIHVSFKFNKIKNIRERGDIYYFLSRHETFLCIDLHFYIKKISVNIFLRNIILSLIFRDYFFIYILSFNLRKII